MSSPVSVLFVRARSAYKSITSIDGLEIYDKRRDARTFDYSGPVVAHPPCRAWGSLRHFAKPEPGERELAIFALDAVRRCGGVLEHPARSGLWDLPGIVTEKGAYCPGGRDAFGGWVLPVYQWDFGHRARKASILYFVGLEPRDLPAIPIALGEATHTIGLWSGRDRARARPVCNKSEFEKTPPAFAAWLVEAAAKCKPPRREAEVIRLPLNAERHTSPRI